MRRQRGLFIGWETVWVAGAEGSFGAGMGKSAALRVVVPGWFPLKTDEIADLCLTYERYGAVNKGGNAVIRPLHRDMQRAFIIT